jgi:hypothetical protein
MVASQTPETPLRRISRRRHRSSVAAAVALASWLMLSPTGSVETAAAKPPLPVGTGVYTFSVGADGTTCTWTTVLPAAVGVAAPASAKPTDKLTPEPTANPTAGPTARPTARPTAKVTPKPSRKPTKAMPKPSAKPIASKTPRPAHSVTVEPTPGETVVVPSRPVVTARPSPSSTPRPPGGGTAGSGSGEGGSGSTPGVDAAIGAFGMVTEPLVAWLLSTFGGVLLLLFLMQRGMSDPTA